MTTLEQYLALNGITDWFLSVYHCSSNSTPTKYEEELRNKQQEKLEEVKRRITPIMSDCLELDFIEELNYKYKLDIVKNYIIQINIKTFKGNYNKWFNGEDWRYSDFRKFNFNYGNVLQGISLSKYDAENKSVEIMKAERYFHRDSEITLIPVYESHIVYCRSGEKRFLHLVDLITKLIKFKVIDINIK